MMTMLSKRLRRRLRQIEEGPAADRPAAECDEPVSRRSRPVSIGDPKLSRDRLSRQSRPAPPPSPPTGPIEELAPGEVVETDAGSYWLVAGHAREMLPHGSEILRRFERLTALLGERSHGLPEGLRGLAPTDLVLLDTETAGLSSAPIFLVGVIVWETDEVEQARFLQLFARDYAEEPAVLAASAELLRGRGALMTYNGRSFDLPLIRERMIYHGLGECPEPLAHVDLLHRVRARFRESWDSCSLQSCEKRLCGRSRWGDIDGAEIPAAWHDFVHTGDAGRMLGVLEHNRLDLITMLEVLPHLRDPGEDV
jgi:uncharacterized protein YprB with RNaseH-like and TPR domain